MGRRIPSLYVEKRELHGWLTRYHQRFSVTTDKWEADLGRKILVVSGILLGALGLVGGASVAEGRRYFVSKWCPRADVLFHNGECYIFVGERVSGWSGNRLEELLLLRELLGFR